ncbi:flagellar protein FlaG [Bacillus sp. AFS073361]|uniref:flagellar protein FlaG n=1 Tax=Bacillus sp. AFS073361 TaxID=2033511 RepID=UPI0015D4FBC5|nr:flagellar protein FlaG [Bacillus sp. AFS073361]
MEVPKIPSIQNHAASDQRENQTPKEQTPVVNRSEQQTDKQLEDTVKQLNVLADQSQFFLKFTLHDKSGEYFVKVIDSKTNEVIREIPSKKMLDYFSDMKKFLGIIFDKSI